METKKIMSYPVKKSLYLFLCAILGALLFLILHRILAFAYFMLLFYNFSRFAFGMPLLQIMALDYFTLILILFLGLWYGIWVGSYWYEAVYEGDHGGFIGHVVRHYWPSKTERYQLRDKIAQVEDKLEGDLWQLEDLAKKAETMTTAAIKPKKRIVRRKTPGKVT